MNIWLSVGALLLAYVAGSLPTAVWAGKIFHGIDIREHGSGNAGATNTIRVMGWKTGIPVLIIDLAKGFLAASLPVILNLAPEESTLLMAMKIACGMAAITGHVFPVLAGFKGGKGVATFLGAANLQFPFGNLGGSHQWSPYAYAGMGLLSVDVDDESDTDLTVNFGLGMDARFGRWAPFVEYQGIRGFDLNRILLGLRFGH